jgi:hypothetical protein
MSLILAGVAFLVTLAVLSSMLRRPALRRLGLRNLTRRKWNTVLVVVGSMVGTALISGSLVLNDSTGRFQEDEARQTLGEIDEVVQQTGQRVPSDRRPIPLFDAAVAGEITPQAVRDLSEATGDERSAMDRMLGALGVDERVAGVDGVLAVLTGEFPAESLDEGGGDGGRHTGRHRGRASSWEELGSFGESPRAWPSVPSQESGRCTLGGYGGGAGVAGRFEGAARGEVGDRRSLRWSAVVPEEGISGYEGRFSSAVGTALVGEEDARGLFGAGEGRPTRSLSATRGM